MDFEHNGLHFGHNELDFEHNGANIESTTDWSSSTTERVLNTPNELDFEHNVFGFGDFDHNGLRFGHNGLRLGSDESGASPGGFDDIGPGSERT